jgi:type I restriction enzyme S subunit
MDTKALRQKILDLAIRGKLVPQDPNDEPAEVLLERIREQKQQMLKEGKLKKKDIKNDTIIFKGEDNLHYEKLQDGTVKCIEDEIPFEVPEGWAWARVSSVVQIYLGLTHTPDYVNKGVPFYSVKDISSGGLDTSNPKYISEEEFDNFPSGAKPQKGDILFGRVGTLGKPTVVEIEEPFGIFVSLGFFRKIYEDFSSEYIMEWMDSSLFWNQVSVNVKGAVLTNLNTGWLSRFLMPIPPIREQVKISDYVKVLLAKTNFISTTEEELINLVTVSKSKILDLAIRGKLVPQDPNDEPASVLLERIRAEKEELIKQGKIKRDKKESIIFRGDDNSYYERVGDIISNIDDEIPFEVPQNWEWSRLQTICYPITDGTHKTPTYSDSGYIFLSAKNITTGKINWNDIMYIPKSLHDELYSRVSPKMNDILLAKNGTTGVAAIVDRECEFDIYVTLALLRVINNNISSQYLLKIIASNTIQDYFKSSLKGIGVPNLHLEHIRTTLIPIPPINEQNKIVEKIYQYYSLLDSIVQNIE